MIELSWPVALSTNFGQENEAFMIIYIYIIEILTQSPPHSQPPPWLPLASSAPVGCDGDDASFSSYASLSPKEKGGKGGKREVKS